MSKGSPMTDDDVLLCAKGTCPRCDQSLITITEDDKPYPLPPVTKQFEEFNLKGIGGPVVWHLYHCTSCEYQATLGEPVTPTPA